MPAERKSEAVGPRGGPLRAMDRRGCAPVLGSGGGVPCVDVRLRLRTCPAAEPLSRSTGDDGTGELVALRRAWTSRNAATDMRWEESLAKLSPRGRGRTGGSKESTGGESGVGEVGREEETWRKDFKLNESAAGRGRAEEDLVSRDGVGAVGLDGLDCVRPRGRAHENSPLLLGGLGSCRGE